MTFNLKSQIRAAFQSASNGNWHGRFKAFVNKKWREDGTFMKMLVTAFGPDHPKGLSEKTLEKCLAAGCFRTDHVFGCVTDDVENFFLMPKTLNTKFSFHSEQQFKEEYTGGAWESVVVFVKHALIMYRSSGRL